MSLDGPMVRQTGISAVPEGRFFQICFVVADLEDGMARYSQNFGAGPWFTGSSARPEDDPTVHRGRLTPLQARFALAYAGEVMLELVAPSAGSRSIFSEWAAVNGYDSLHHYGFAVEDLDSALVSMAAGGTSPAMTSRTARGTRVVMFDGADDASPLQELVEVLPATERFYGLMRRSASVWNRRSLLFEGEVPVSPT